MSWFSNWWKKLVQRANSVWRDDVAPAVKDAWEQFSDELGNIAFDAVSKLAVSQLTGAQKFDDAVKTVLTEAKNRGWAIGTSAVQLLVQRAYVNYKAKSGSLVIIPPVAPTE